jgi:hypothetical protein
LKYHPDDIVPLDPIEHLQRNENQFFRSGTYDAIELAGMIATEALTLGAENIHIHSDEEWLTVTADQDWLKSYEHEAFRAITPFPESGVNSMLAEILAVAFSTGVTTATRDGSMVIKGGVASPIHAVSQNAARTVAFTRQREFRPLK